MQFENKSPNTLIDTELLATPTKDNVFIVCQKPAYRGDFTKRSYGTNVFHDFLFYPQIVPMEREVTKFIQFEKRIDLIE